MCFAKEKKECILVHLRTACIALLAWASVATPIWAQSKAEAVLQSFVRDFATTGVSVTQGSKSVAQDAVEWRDVVVSMPRVKGNLKLGFIRSVEQADGSFVIEYPRMVTGTLAPVAGLAPLNLVATGEVLHLVSSAERGAVHKISTDSVSGVLNGADPASYTTVKIKNFALDHTADRGVPLQLNRIRDILFSGVFELDMKGGFAVLDRLVDLRKVSTSQADIARTMVRGFTTQGADGTDHLQLRVDVRENGAILINGNPF